MTLTMTSTSVLDVMIDGKEGCDDLMEEENKTENNELKDHMLITINQIMIMESNNVDHMIEDSESFSTFAKVIRQERLSPKCDVTEASRKQSVIRSIYERFEKSNTKSNVESDALENSQIKTNPKNDQVDIDIGKTDKSQTNTESSSKHFVVDTSSQGENVDIPVSNLGEEGTFVGQTFNEDSSEGDIQQQSVISAKVTSHQNAQDLKENQNSKYSFINLLTMREWFQQKSKDKQFHYHSEKIDEILNSFPSTLIQNLDKGLLSTLYSNTVSDQKLEELQNLAMECEGWELFNRVILGKDTIESNLKTDLSNVSMENILDGDDPDDPLSLSMFAGDPFLCQDEQEDDSVKYQEGAWWIEEMQKRGWLDIDTNNIEVEESAPPVISKEGALDSLLNYDKYIEQPKSSNETDSNEVRNNASSEIDWKERLWTAARTHYHKALAADDENVSKFRDIIEVCLVAFVDVFHTDFESQKPFGELLLLCKVPRFVPVPLLTHLIEKVVEDYFKEHDGMNFKDIIDCKTRNNITSAVRDACLDLDIGIFSRFKVKLVDISADMLVDTSTNKNNDEKRSVKDNSSFYKRLPKRFKRNLMLPKEDETLELERFLYGENISILDEIKKEKLSKSPAGITIEVQDKNQSALEEVKLKSSLIQHLRMQRRKECRPTWNAVFATILLGQLSFEPGVDVSSCEDDPSLSVVFALQYLIRFLLRCHLVCPEKDITDKATKLNEHQNSKTVGFIETLILNFEFLNRRVRALGAYLSGKEFINEWKCLEAIKSRHMGCISTTKEISQSSEPEEYERHIFFFNHLISTLELILGSVSGTVLQKTSKHLNKNQKLDIIFEEKGKGEKLTLRDCLDVSFCCIDIGRCCYELGITLGKTLSDYEVKQVKHMHRNLESGKVVELSAYSLAMKSFRKSEELLLSYKNIKGIIDSDVQMRQVHDLIVSNDLYLGDCLVASGYCYDTKISDHKKALLSYQEALSIYKKHFGNNHTTVSNVLQNLGSICHTIKKFEDALKYYKHRLSILTRLISIEKSMEEKAFLILDEAHTLRCIGITFRDIGDNDNALYNFEKAICQYDFHRKNKINSDTRWDLADVLSEVGRIYAKQSAELEASWHSLNFRDISSYTNNEEQSIISIDHLLRAHDFEAKALSSLGQSISLRSECMLGSHAFDCHKDIVLKDLTQLGIYNFRDQNYKKAASYFECAWKLVTKTNERLGNLRVEDTVRCLCMTKIEHVPVKSLKSSYEFAVPLLFYMGIVSTRLMKHQYALSCFNLAKELCELIRNTLPALSGQNSQINGLDLDLAKINESIGFVCLKNGDLMSAASHFRSSLRLLDGFLFNYSNRDMDVDLFSVSSIQKLEACAAEDFTAQLYVRVSIGILLNKLGRVYECKKHTQKKALTCFEDSMLILDGINEELKNNSNLFVASPSPIQKSLIECKISSVQSTVSLADSYFRAGKNYLSRGMKEDSMMAFERAIEMLEYSAHFSKRDDENTSDKICSNESDNHLLEVSILMLDLMGDENDSDWKGAENEKKKKKRLNFTKEDLHFRIGNTYARMKNFQAALERYKLAEKLTECRLKTRNHSIMANIVHNMGVMEKELIPTNSKFKRDAEIKFKEAINIAQNAYGDNRLLAAESLVQLADLIMQKEEWEMNCCAGSSIREKEVLLCIEHALKINYEVYEEKDINIARTLFLTGKYYLYTWNIDQAVEKLTKAIAIYQGDVRFQVEKYEVIYTLGLAYLRAASNVDTAKKPGFSNGADRALHQFHEIISSFTASNENLDLRLAIKAMYQTATIYLLKKEFIKGMNCISIMFKHLRAFDGDISQLSTIIASVWFKLGCLQESRGNVIDALKCLTKCLNICSGQKPGDCSSKTLKITDADVVTVKLAKLWCKYEKYEEAKALLLSNISDMTMRFDKSPEKMGIVFFYLAESFQRDDDESVEKYLLEALRRHNDKTPFVFQGFHGLIHQRISKSYRKKNDLGNTLKHARKAVALLEQFQSKEERTSLIPISMNIKDLFENEFIAQEHWSNHLINSLSLQFVVNTSLTYFERQPTTLDLTLKLGKVCRKVGKMDEAIQCFYSVLKYNQVLEGNDGVTVHNCLLQISEIYVNQSKYVNSLPCLEECYVISSLTRDAQSQSKMISNLLVLSNVCFQLNRFTESNVWVEKGLHILSSSNTDHGVIAIHFLILQVNVFAFEFHADK